MTERRLEPHELAEAGPAEAVRLPVELIDPNPANPRHQLAEIDALAESIRDPSISLIHPIAVRRMGDRYQVLSGHRRLAAFAWLADQEPHEVRWKTIPATVRTADDQAAYLALISAQAHSRSWTPREEASVLEELASTRTLAAVGHLIHKSEPWVQKRLKVYADAVLSGLVQTGKLAPSIAQEFIGVKDPAVRRDLALRAIDEQWSMDHARAEVRKLSLSAEIRDLSRRTQEMLALLGRVQVDQIDITVFRDLLVLRGRIDQLSQQARGGTGPVFPSIERAAEVAGVKPNARQKPTPIRRKPGYKPKID